GAAIGCSRVGENVMCWGRNEFGDLGRGTFDKDDHPPAPVSMTGSDVELLAAGNFTCALKRDGSVWCWGHNCSRQMGNGTTGCCDVGCIDLPPGQATPQPVHASFKARDLVATSATACALAEDGAVWCWGSNSNGIVSSTPLEGVPWGDRIEALPQR